MFQKRLTGVFQDLRLRLAINKIVVFQIYPSCHRLLNGTHAPITSFAFFLRRSARTTDLRRCESILINRSTFTHFSTTPKHAVDKATCIYRVRLGKRLKRTKKGGPSRKFVRYSKHFPEIAATMLIIGIRCVRCQLAINSRFYSVVFEGYFRQCSHGRHFEKLEVTASTTWSSATRGHKLPLGHVVIHTPATFTANRSSSPFLNDSAALGSR